MVISDNASYYSALYVSSSRNVVLANSSVFNNTSLYSSTGAYIYSSDLAVESSVLWNPGALPEIYTNSAAAVTATYSLVRNDEVPDPTNLTGVTDIGLRGDGYQLWSSPLRDAGARTNSGLDLQLEGRPATGADIGADEWIDTDGDELADVWELEKAGSLTVLSGRASDHDGDGVDNEYEYETWTDPTSGDTDGDGLSDGGERTAGSDPLDPDTDDDGMLDGAEVGYGFDPLVDDAYRDADGDRYPNVFEIAKGTSPVDAAAMPTPDVLVDLANGSASTSDNLYPTVNAAIQATGTDPTQYQIVGLRPGTYTGSGNANFSVAATRPHLLIIGLEGASRTIIDGEATLHGPYAYRRVAFSSLTIRRTVTYPLALSSGSGSMLSDLVFLDNDSYYGTLYISSSRAVSLQNSTLLANRSQGLSVGVYAYNSDVQIDNSVLSNPWTLPEVYTNSAATVSATYSLIRDDELPDPTNLTDITDLGMNSDGRLRPGSPLRGAGTLVGSRLDMDLEMRPTTGVDIGADQWTDLDGDGMADTWERQWFGDLITANATSDFDADGLIDVQEHLLGADPTDPDTDRDGLSDGEEVQFGTNPLVQDLEELRTDINGDGVIDAIGVRLGYHPSNPDVDGDGISNVDERARGLDPLSADTDGDGVDDGVDAMPLDPLVSTLSTGTNPPNITLEQPSSAVAR